MSSGAASTVGSIEEGLGGQAGSSLKLIAADVGLYLGQGDVVGFEIEFAGIEGGDVGDEYGGVAARVGENDELSSGAGGTVGAIEDWC